MPAGRLPFLTEAERARIEAACEADPALAEELEAMSAQFSSGARRRFWRAFAAGSARSSRPAAAVLTALERATLSDER